jgi:glycosyltransferase involved in cell wall biosynthesis
MANIIIISHISPPAIDGGSRVITKIGDYLSSQGHNIITLTSNANSTDDFTHKYQPVNFATSNVFRLPVYTVFHRILKPFSKVLSKGPIFKIIPFLKFVIYCFSFNPDYIIAGPMPTTIILYARFLKTITRSKLIINASFHHTDPEFHQPILTNTLQTADLIWTLTRFETRYLHNNFKIPLSKIICLGNGIDKSLLTNNLRFIKNSKLKIKNLLYIGSFSAHKGLETLFSAFKKLSTKYSLTIAGKSTLYHLNIPHNVTIITNFPDGKLAKLIDDCDILISPSTQESFGLVLLEAMARGRPVIAANIPTSSELINNSLAGVTFKQNNPYDLSLKIQTLCKSPLLYKRLSNNGLLYASNHTWDKIGESLWQKMLSL